MPRGRPKTDLISRLNLLFPQGDWGAYPQQPLHLCWPAGKFAPQIHHGGTKRHPVTAFFIELGGTPGKFRIVKLCRGWPDCVSPYHFIYQPLGAHDLSAPGLDYPLFHTYPPNDDLADERKLPYEEFYELCLGLVSSEDIRALYLNQPRTHIVEARQRQRLIGRRAYCAPDAEQEAARWRAELGPESEVVIKIAMAEGRKARRAKAHLRKIVTQHEVGPLGG